MELLQINMLKDLYSTPFSQPTNLWSQFPMKPWHFPLREILPNWEPMLKQAALTNYISNEHINKMPVNLLELNGDVNKI